MSAISEHDVVVVGSGAAGLTAALTAAVTGLDVAVLEKSEILGGSSAWSGGMAWMPLNEHEAASGVQDSAAEVLDYIRGLTEGREPDPDLIDAFVESAAQALSFVERHTALRMAVLSRYPDYYGEREGSRLVGRSVEPRPTEFRSLLGEWYDRVRESPLLPMLTREEMVDGVPAEPLSSDRRAAGVRTLGSALISGLLAGALQHGATIRTGTRVLSLTREGDRVVGVEAERDGKPLSLRARVGVVLASGGFEHDAELVRASVGAAELMPLSPAGNVGDGLRMGLRLGAATAGMSHVLSRPCTYDGTTTVEGVPLPFMGIPRHDPGCVMVNRFGRRFVNEGLSYMDMGKALRAFDPLTATYPDAAPIWMVFDSVARSRIAIGDFVPGGLTPDWVMEADDVQALAEEMGIDGEVLGEELDRFNEAVDLGVDAAFGRGTVWFEGLSQGGPSPQKNMQRVERAPFYAMRLHPGAFATIGGLRIDREARVLDHEHEPLAGLWAVGNVAAGVLGQAYPGGGSSLGPNITFGYLAGRALASRADSSILRS